MRSIRNCCVLSGVADCFVADDLFFGGSAAASSKLDRDTDAASFCGDGEMSASSKPVMTISVFNCRLSGLEDLVDVPDIMASLQIECHASSSRQ